MTNTSHPRTLRRRSQDRMVGGVCGGIADATGVEVSLIRAATVLLAIFGGAGIPIYLVAWLFIPEEGQDRSAADRLFSR